MTWLIANWEHIAMWAIVVLVCLYLGWQFLTGDVTDEGFQADKF